MGDDRDDQQPKSGRIWDRPRSQPVHSLAVPGEIYEDVTGRFDTMEAEADARFRRDVMRMLRQQNVKTGAIGKYVRDEFRKSSAERERRRADEAEQRQRKEAAKQRRHQLLRSLISKEVLTAIGAAVAGVIAALKATGTL